MSYPILYDPNESEFFSNGIGILNDCELCEVTEEASGKFELFMRYPIDGVHSEDITDRSIIKASVGYDRNPQLFRVYSITKPMSGSISISAAHISYDLSGIVLRPFSTNDPKVAVAGMKDYAVSPCPFNFSTNILHEEPFAVETPCSIRSRLGGDEGTLAEVYGGEWEFDNFDVRLLQARGRDNGVTLRYGKNIRDAQQERNCANIATGIYPYWLNSENGEIVELPEKIVSAPGEFDFTHILAVDLTDEFLRKPFPEMLRAKAKKYISKSNIGKPVVSLNLQYSQLYKASEYQALRHLEFLNLFDTVTVIFPKFNISTKARVSKVVYDALRERILTLTLGEAGKTIAYTVAMQGKSISQKPSQAALRTATSHSVSSMKDYLKTYSANVVYSETKNGEYISIVDGEFLAGASGQKDESFALRFDEPNAVKMTLPESTEQSRELYIRWQSNGDGTYTPIGTTDWSD